MRGIGAGERVDDVEDRLHVEIRDDLVAEPEEVLLLERLVDVSPPDAVLRAGLAHDELVLRRAARVDAGVDDERPALGEHALLARERVRVEHRRASDCGEMRPFGLSPYSESSTSFAALSRRGHRALSY